MTDGGPAFPWISDERENSGMIGQGMTLRDYFAAKAIPLWALDDEEVKRLQEGELPDHKTVAKFCYDLADAMLAERAKPHPTERPNNP